MTVSELLEGDVFVSYKREDSVAVTRLVAELRRANLKVWWDQDIAPTAPWEATIERRLADAKVVIVVWSNASVGSENVKAEARYARNQGKLIQVFVEHCTPPIFFGERQGIDLSRWRGATTDGNLALLVSAVNALLSGKRPQEGVGYVPKRRSWAMVFAAVAIALATLGVISDLGGARDTVCGLGPFSSVCADLGLVDPSSTPAPSVAEVRHSLLDGLVGVWGRQDRSCDETVRYSVETDDHGVTRIFARGGQYEGTSQVVAAENGTIVARSISESPEGPRDQWEFRPDGDRLTVYDKDGVATTLVRCQSSP